MSTESVTVWFKAGDTYARWTGTQAEFDAGAHLEWARRYEQPESTQ